MTGSAQRILHHAVVEKLVMAPSWCRSPRAAQGPLPRCDAMLDWFRSKSGPSTFRSGQSRPEISEKMKFGKRESEARAGKGKKEAGILLTSEYSFGRACFTGSLAGSWGPGSFDRWPELKAADQQASPRSSGGFTGLMTNACKAFEV
jgi:hypothetical protein